MKITINDGKRVVVIGTIADRTLIKQVKRGGRGKHFMERFNGYGIQFDAFSKYQDQFDKIVFDEGRRKLVISKDWFMKHRQGGEFGYGKQWFINEKFCTVEDKYQGDLFEKPTKGGTENGRQNQLQASHGVQ